MRNKAPAWDNYHEDNQVWVCSCEPLAHSHQVNTHSRWSYNKQYTLAENWMPPHTYESTHGEVLLVCQSSLCVRVCLRRIIACYSLRKPVRILLTLLLGVTSGTLRVYHATHEEVLEIAAATSSKCVYVCIKKDKSKKICVYNFLITFSVFPVVILIS